MWCVGRATTHRRKVQHVGMFLYFNSYDIFLDIPSVSMIDIF